MTTTEKAREEAKVRKGAAQTQLGEAVSQHQQNPKRRKRPVTAVEKRWRGMERRSTKAVGMRKTKGSRSLSGVGFG